jgi:hypothetical protein
MLIQLEFAHDYEADQPAQDFREQGEELLGQFAHIAVILTALGL